MGWGHGCPGFSLKLFPSMCCSLVQRRGWLPPAWYESWGVSNIRWRSDLWGVCHGGVRTEGGNTPWWRRQERRRSLSLCKPTFGEGRIRWRSILQRGLFWTCVRRRRGSEGTGGYSVVETGGTWPGGCKLDNIGGGRVGRGWAGRIKEGG